MFYVFYKYVSWHNYIELHYFKFFFGFKSFIHSSLCPKKRKIFFCFFFWNHKTKFFMFYVLWYLDFCFYISCIFWHKVSKRETRKWNIDKEHNRQHKNKECRTFFVYMFCFSREIGMQIFCLCFSMFSRNIAYYVTNVW